MTDSKYLYPFVECSHHPGPQRGYAICRHVIEGDPVAGVNDPSGDSIGEIYCRECASTPDEHKNLKDFKLVCEGCAADHGFLKGARL